MTAATQGPAGATDSLFARALSLYEQGDAAAAALFEAVLAVDPSHVAARYKLANLHKEAGALDRAQAGYDAVLCLEPAHAEALNNLGAVHQMRGDNERAQVLYRQAMASNPGLAAPALNLGRLLQELGRNFEAARIYAEAQARGLDAGLFGHLLAATEGKEAGARAPRSYVRETFDAFAPGFEQRLVGELGYGVPAALAALVRGRSGAADVAGAGARLDVLDLGCGTGLVGDALGAKARSLVGVDLSPRMLGEARSKGRYTDLQEADIAAWLADAPSARFDLVVAADVFIYIGELDAVFAGVARCLRNPGWLAFSVESCDGDRWQLLPSGRYAQSETYIAKLAERHGYTLCARQAAQIRRGAAGALYLLQKA